jgi:tripartite-type tricarboxylate transporter receptor subunit TctC
MTLGRREFLQLSASAAALAVASPVAFAATYPSRPVRVVVGFPPGAATDIVGRLIAQSLGERLGRQFFVDNRPGAGSNLAADIVAKSAPDGYTLLAMTVTNAVNETLYKNLNFDFMRDLAPIARTIRSANVLVVNPSVPAMTVPEFIAYAKANPSKLNYASFGIGTAPHMAAEMFNMMTGTKLIHVPYHSSFTPDLLSGQVQLAFLPIPLIIGFIRSGKVRALGVTSATPSAALPGVPTIAQTVPGYAADIWHGIAAPKGTPTAIIDKLNADINGILTDPAMQPKFANLGADPAPLSVADLEKFIVGEVEKWAKVIKFADIKAG